MKQQRGFNDFLQYMAMIAPGVMKLKCGAYMAGFAYKGPDEESETKETVEYLAASYNRAIMNLDDGWMIHQIAVRTLAHEYPNGDDISEPTNMLIDFERFAQFTDSGQHYETKMYLFLTYLPPQANQSTGRKQFVDWIMGHKEDKTVSYQERELKEFEKGVDTFMALFSQEMEIQRLMVSPNGNDELVFVLNYIMNKEEHPVVLDQDQFGGIDCLLARDVYDGEHFVYDGELTAILTIDGLPVNSSPTMFAEIDRMAMDLVWSTRFIITDQHFARDKVESDRKKWIQKVSPFMDKIMNRQSSKVNQYAVQRVRELDEAAALLEDRAIVYGHYTSTIIIQAEDEDMLKRRITEVVRLCERIGCVVRKEERNSMEAFIGSLPGHGRENVRKPYLHSLNVADLSPLSYEWCGDKYCPCPEPKYPYHSAPLLMASSTGTTPFRFNLHVGDVGHTLIFGPTGAGKSTLLCLIASQFDRYRNNEGASQIFVFDKGYSMYPLVSACFNAAHYDLGSLGSGYGSGLCPLAEIDTEADRGWALEYIESLIRLQKQSDVADADIAAADKKLIQQALVTLANSTSRSEERTMSDFISTVQSQKVKEILSAYQTGTTAGNFIDGKENKIRYSKFTCFEMEELLSYQNPAITMPVLLYLFRQIEKRLDGRPSLLIIDEAWLALSNEIFSKKIVEWLKVLRKANCAIVLATQSVSDVANSSIRDAIIDNCVTKIFLPNPEANSDINRELYQKTLKLNNTQINLISRAVRKRQYYIVNENGRRLFDLCLGPVALSFVGAASKEDLALIRALQERYGEIWPEEWLKQRGLNEAAAAWRNGYDAVNSLVV